MSKETEAEKTARLRKLRLEVESKRKPQKKSVFLHKMDTELIFGKFKGSTIDEVLESKGGPQWIQWAIDTIDSFEVDDEVIKFIHYLNDPRKPIDRN